MQPSTVLALIKLSNTCQQEQQTLDDDDDDEF